jgi:hypothetical protein
MKARKGPQQPAKGASRLLYPDSTRKGGLLKDYGRMPEVFELAQFRTCPGVGKAFNERNALGPTCVTDSSANGMTLPRDRRSIRTSGDRRRKSGAWRAECGGGCAYFTLSRNPGKWALCRDFRDESGGGGIRTLVGPKWPETVFETAAFNHSATPPRWRVQG